MAKMPDDGQVQYKGDAPRFSLTLPMRYRPTGHPQWRNTKTANVSSSGALFLATERLAAGQQLEIEISMTATLLKPSRIIATSEVVRQGYNAQLRLTAVQHRQYRMVDGDLE